MARRVPDEGLGRARRDVAPVVATVGGVLEDRPFRSAHLGCLIPGAVINTVAVAVTVWPETELYGTRATDVVVCAAFTSWVTGVTEVDPSKLPSPE